MEEEDEILAEHYFKHIHKQPCYTEYERGQMWMDDILGGHHIRTINMFRMDAEVLVRLCNDLEQNYALSPSREVSILEKVGIFLYTLAQGASVRVVAEHFQRSTQTVHGAFHDVLISISGCDNGWHGLAGTIIRPRNPEFPRTPSHIAADTRYKDYFKVRINASNNLNITHLVSHSNIISGLHRLSWWYPYQCLHPWRFTSSVHRSQTYGDIQCPCCLWF